MLSLAAYRYKKFTAINFTAAYRYKILFDLVFISRPVVWSHAMLHLCFLAQPFALANLPVYGVVLQVLM